MRKEHASDSLLTFGNVNKCDILILMGLTETSTGEIRRDIGIVPFKETPLSALISAKLLSREDIVLDLEPKNITIASLPLAKFYEQRNVRASRKQILPLIQAILNDF